MLTLLRSRRWIAFTLLVVIAIVGFGLLSRWQWQRADEERGKREAIAAQAALTPVPLDRALDDPTPWTPVRITGTYAADATVLVRQRPLEGRNGFWVMSALDTDLGRVWVNRGWIPATGAATGIVPAPDAPDGPIDLVGRLRPADGGGRPEPADLPRGQVTSVQPASLGADVTDYYIEATASLPADLGVTPLPAPTPDEAQNISYAVQWLIFAVIAITGWWYFLRREAREDARAEAD